MRLIVRKIRYSKLSALIKMTFPVFTLAFCSKGFTSSQQHGEKITKEVLRVIEQETVYGNHGKRSQCTDVMLASLK